MGQGYTRQSAAQINDGEDIIAGPLNAEFNALKNAFDAATGHSHDGSVGESQPINLLTSITGILPVVNGGIAGKHNTSATTAPAVTNDSSADYAVGSFWFDTTAGRIYVCRNAAVGAAVWSEVVYTDGTQTLTNKTLTSPTINTPTITDPTISGATIGTSTLNSPTVNTPTITLKQSTAPTPTAEGDIQWDTDDNSIKVGDGAATLEFLDKTKLLQKANNLSDLANVETAHTNLATDTRIQTMLDAQAVQFDSVQSLTSAQKGQARANIGAGVLGGFRNKIINGKFDVWQRGTSFTASGYTADRWYAYIGSGGAATISNNPLFGNGERRNSLAWAQTTGGTDTPYLAQSVEGVETFSGKTVTVSFENITSVGISVTPRIVQNFGSGGSAAVVTTGSAISLATTGKLSQTLTLPTVAGKTVGTGDRLRVDLVFPTGTTFTVYLTKISLVEGDATTEDDPFSPRHIQQELALCQRYYSEVEIRPLITASGAEYVAGMAYWPVEMRVVPTVSATNKQVVNCGSLTIDTITTTGARTVRTSSGSSSAVYWELLHADAEL